MRYFKLTIIIFILLFSTIFIFAQDKGIVIGKGKWKTANENVVRLAPSEFFQLPKIVVAHLTKQNCTIPQTYFDDEKHNVIQGEFRIKGEKDWAVLCSIDKKSSVYIYWNGLAENISIIEEKEDSSFLQTIGGGKIGFSRIISTVGDKYIYDHYKSYGGTEPPEINHNGIDDGFAEKASTVLYFYKGKWLQLQGAD